jgi:hypothetical protein
MSEKSFTKETKLGSNQFKVERIKKADDEIGYQRSLKKEETSYKDSREGMKKGGMTKGQKKIRTVMREFKAKKLKSSSGQKVTNPKQAIAIALSEAGQSKKMKKAKGGAFITKGGDYIKDLL